MNKFKKLMCGLLLVPCVLVGSACSKDTKVSTEGYTKALLNSAETFYNTKFYPNDGNGGLSTRPITFTAERESMSKTKKNLEYNHVDNGDGSVSSETKEYYEVITTEINETIALRAPEGDASTASVLIEINNETISTKKGLKATEDDKNVEKYTEVTVVRNNIIFIYNSEGSTVYKSSYIKDAEGEETTSKTAYTYTDTTEQSEDVYDFLEDIDNGLVESFFNFDLELIIIGGKLYKDGSSFGFDAGYAATDIEENEYVRMEYDIECDFKNNLPHKYSMEIKNESKSFMGLEHTIGEMESSITIKYSAKEITAPTGYEETTNKIELNAVSLG